MPLLLLFAPDARLTAASSARNDSDMTLTGCTGTTNIVDKTEGRGRDRERERERERESQRNKSKQVLIRIKELQWMALIAGLLVAAS